MFIKIILIAMLSGLASILANKGIDNILARLCNHYH